MAFFPEEFDPASDVIGLLDLVSMDTEDGIFRFLLGIDGMFRDINGNVWTGCQLFESSDLRASIQGEAPQGILSMTFIPDPSDGDLVAQIRALGTDYVKGREVIFWVQPFNSPEELQAPVLPPLRWLTRRATHVEFDLSGALERRIALNIEGPFTGRNTAPGLQYTVADHGRMTGSANSSLRFMPTDTFQEQKLFG